MENELQFILDHYKEIPDSFWTPLYTPNEWEISHGKKPSEDRYVWLLDEYQVGDYSGSGERIGIDKDGNLVYGYTSHCSCYGPWDNESTGDFEKATYKEMTVKVENVTKSDWGARFEQNVKAIYDAMWIHSFSGLRKETIEVGTDKGDALVYVR